MLIAPRLLWSIHPSQKGCIMYFILPYPPSEQPPLGLVLPGGRQLRRPRIGRRNAKPRCRQTAPPRSRQRRLISASAKDGTFPPFPAGSELALSPPFRRGLNWHFPPLSGGV